VSSMGGPRRYALVKGKKGKSKKTFRGYRKGKPLRSRNSAMARSFALEKTAAKMLLHPFKGAYKGLKYPDADSSASVPLTIRHIFTITPGDIGSGTATGHAAAVRILPTGDTQIPSVIANNDAGDLTVTTWADPVRVADWASYDGNFSRYRVINYGIRVMYMGDSETSKGKFSILVHPYGAGTAPLNSNTNVTYMKTLPIKDLKGLVIEPRRISGEALHYEPTVAFGTAGYVTLEDCWEVCTLFVENASTTSQPVVLELIWNMELLPGNGAVSSAVSSPALPDLPHIMNAVSTLGAQLDRVISALSEGAKNDGPNLMSVIGGIAGSMGQSAYDEGWLIKSEDYPVDGTRAQRQAWRKAHGLE